jgi:hypothetical protein
MIAFHFACDVLTRTAAMPRFDVMLEHEMAQREVRRKRGDVITIVTESLPITAIQSYVLLQGSEVGVISMITLLFASVVLGAKMSGLGMYKTARIRRDNAEKAFNETFGVQVEEIDEENDGGNDSEPALPSLVFPSHAMHLSSAIACSWSRAL